MKYVIQINNLNNNLMIYYIHLLTRFNLVKWISKNYKYDDIVIIDDINDNECIICNICDFPYMFFKNRPKLNQNEYNKILNILHDINDLEIISFYITLLLQFDFDDRIVKKHQEKLIKYLSSDLSEIPYDVHKGEKAVVRKLRNGVEKYIKLFCKCGLTYANCFIMDKVVRCFQDYSHR